MRWWWKGGKKRKKNPAWSRIYLNFTPWEPNLQSWGETLFRFQRWISPSVLAANYRWNKCNSWNSVQIRTPTLAPSVPLHIKQPPWAEPQHCLHTAADESLALAITGSISHEEIISVSSAAVWREIILEEPNELALWELSELMRRSESGLRKRGCVSGKDSTLIGSRLLWMFKEPFFFFFPTAIYFLSGWRTKTITDCTNCSFPL